MSNGKRTDGELLAEFVSDGSEPAFEQIVRRHGRLVLGVCRRVLGEHAGAEDAAQAVFLTLAHKAGALKRHSLLAGWLHRVARNVALRARESRDLRRKREGEVGEMVRRNRTAGRSKGAAERLLDGALDSLPEKYRMALIMHHVEGLSEGEVARAMGCRPGTLSWRLARGRELLRQRLERRGSVIPAATLTGLLAAASGPQLPAAFAAATAKAASLALAGQAAAGGAVAANVALMTKGALNAMFWAKVKVAAAVLGTAAVVGAGVPVAVQAVKAAEKPGKNPAAVAARHKTSAEKPLKYRRIGNPLFHSQRRPRGSGSLRVGAWWSQESYSAGWEFYAKNVNKQASLPQVDFRAGMAVGIHIKLEARTGGLKGLDRVVEAGGEVRVYYRRGLFGPLEDRGPQSLLLQVERRNLPVVFCENGKEVARVPLGDQEDKVLAKFLPHVRHAQALALAGYREQLEGNPLFAGLTIDSVALLYGRRPEGDGKWKKGPRDGDLDRLQMPIANMDRKARPGDKLLVAWNSKDGPAVLKWSAAREKAVKFALAPGWQWERGYFRCPWCRNRDFTADVGRCADCGKGTSSGMFKLCGGCAAPKGRCQMCNRTVGPATRGVQVRLLFCPANVNRTIGPADHKRTIAPGEGLRPWVSAYTHGRKVPELACPGGRALGYCPSLFFVVSKQGNDAITVVRHQGERGHPRARMMAPAPLERDSFAQVTLNTGDALNKPGTYTVRAVAGRLVSNPVTVIVERNSAAAKRKVAPPPEFIAPPRKAAPARGAGAGLVPRWNPGGNTLAAIDAGSGETLWKRRMRFAIGNVVDNGATWLVVSQNGAGQATIDARTGKLIAIERLKAKPAAGNRDVF